jgi:hypothetical protein
VVNNISGSFVLTFSPITGMVAAVANLFAGGIFNPYSWIMSMMIGMAGFAMGLVNFSWWVLVSLALWAYCIFLLFMMPLMLQEKDGKSGLQRVFETFKEHKKSLILITLLLVLKASSEFLVTPVTAGILVVSLLNVYNMFFKQGPEAAPTTQPPP